MSYNVVLTTFYLFIIDVICLSETYLDDSYHTVDDQLAFPGYNLIRADNPNNIKRGEVCIYY